MLKWVIVDEIIERGRDGARLAALSRLASFPNEPKKRRYLGPRNISLGVVVNLRAVHLPGATVAFEAAPGRLANIAAKLSQPWRKLCQNAGICTRCRIGFHAREACPHANEIDRLMADIKGKAPNSKALGKG